MTATAPATTTHASTDTGTRVDITVYSKPHCVQCDATKRQLDKTGIAYTVTDMTEDPEALRQVKELGYVQAPVVIVRNEGGETIQHWSGFRIDILKKMAA